MPFSSQETETYWCSSVSGKETAWGDFSSINQMNIFTFLFFFSSPCILNTVMQVNIPLLNPQGKRDIISKIDHFSGQCCCRCSGELHNPSSSSPGGCRKVVFEVLYRSWQSCAHVSGGQGVYMAGFPIQTGNFAKIYEWIEWKMSLKLKICLSCPLRIALKPKRTMATI